MAVLVFRDQLLESLGGVVKQVNEVVRAGRRVDPLEFGKQQFVGDGVIDWGLYA